MHAVKTLNTQAKKVCFMRLELDEFWFYVFLVPLTIFVILVIACMRCLVGRHNNRNSQEPKRSVPCERCGQQIPEQSVCYSHPRRQTGTVYYHTDYYQELLI